MKKELKRIEETLRQLRPPDPLAAAVGAMPQPQSPQALSFTVSPRAATSAAPPVAAHLIAAALPAASPTPVCPAEPPPIMAADLPAVPSLPKLKVPSFSSHRHAANPALAANLLQEMQKVVAGWQQELSQVLRQIQDLYLEGPIVDGWLESYASPVTAESPILRHGEVDHLINYVEAICADPNPTTPDYRLCGLNQAGQLWSSPCPPDQVPSLSLAIARHQKLRQLLTRQQYLETRLSQLAETLVVMQGQLKD